MNKLNKKYLLVIVKDSDILELPVRVCDTLEEAALYLNCSINTLYQNKRYLDYNILIVEDKEDHEL